MTELCMFHLTPHRCASMDESDKRTSRTSTCDLLPHARSIFVATVPIWVLSTVSTAPKALPATSAGPTVVPQLNITPSRERNAEDEICPSISYLPSGDIGSLLGETQFVCSDHRVIGYAPQKKT